MAGTKTTNDINQQELFEIILPFRQRYLNKETDDDTFVKILKKLHVIGGGDNEKSSIVRINLADYYDSIGDSKQAISLLKMNEGLELSDKINYTTNISLGFLTVHDDPLKSSRYFRNAIRFAGDIQQYEIALNGFISATSHKDEVKKLILYTSKSSTVKILENEIKLADYLKEEITTGKEIMDVNFFNLDTRIGKVNFSLKNRIGDMESVLLIIDELLFLTRKKLMKRSKKRSESAKLKKSF